MTKELGTKQFGDDWPRQKLLCYDVRCHVTDTLGYIDLLRESKHSPRDTKALKSMLRRMTQAAEQLEELFHILCLEEEGRASAKSKCVKPEKGN